MAAMEKFNKSLGREIKQMRVKAQKSLAQVINDTGINIGRIEMGWQSVTTSTLMELCEYFNISLWEIIKRAETSMGDVQVSDEVHHPRPYLRRKATKKQ